MATLLLILQLAGYFITLALAGYVLSRSRFHPLAVATAGGLISYALIMADLTLAQDFDTAEIGRVLWLAYPLPVAFWLRITILLRAGDNVGLDRAWWTLVLPVTVVFVLGGWLGDDLLNFSTRETGSLFWTFGIYNVVVTGVAWFFTEQNYRQVSAGDAMRQPFLLLRVAGLGYFGSMLILLSEVVPYDIVFPLLVLDVIIMGVVGIRYDAISEGQTVRRDLAATFIKASLGALLLVSPWLVLVDWSLPAALALLLTLAASALGVSLLDELERWLDRWIYQANAENLARRDALRTLLVNSARQADRVSPITEMDHDEFVRLTRRALSHLPNLPRLAASPLTHMQIVAQRVDPDANTLQRANELRLLLVECIDNLRPYEDQEMGTTDDWRFFNALYYPYVVGISPYKRGRYASDLDAQTAEVLRWFQAAVPPRTLYNWQNRGAELIAEILLEQEKQVSH